MNKTNHPSAFIPYPSYKDSGVAWLGEVPKHWEEKKAKYLFCEIDERSVTGSEELLSVSHITGVTPRSQKNVTMFKAESYVGSKLCQSGDLVINTMWAWMAALGVSKQSGIVSTAYNVYRLRNDKTFVQDYIDKLLRTWSYKAQYHINSTGVRASRLRLYPDKFFSIPICIPPKKEQECIANFLKYKTAQIARFIKAKKRMIELLKEQKQVIINDAVTGKIVIKDEGGRLKAEKRPDSSFIPHPSSFLQTVPEGWEVRRLRTIATVKPSGVDKKSHESELPVLLCNYVDVYKNQEINSSLNFMKATATPEEISSFTLIHGDIIITKDSETWDDIAVPAIVTENMDVVCAYHLALIRTTTQEIINKYLYRAISADPIADHFRVSANGVTRFGLSQGAIKDAPIPIPSIQEQAQIVSYIETKTAALYLTISRTEREIALMQEYRTRLISDVVTGKVDVRDIKIPDIAGIDDTIDESIDEPEGEEELETAEAEE